MSTITKITKAHKSNLIRHFEKGKKVKDIAHKYPQYTRQQLAGIKAHVKMGTY